MIRGAIFDMDGTLLDSMSAWDRAGEVFLQKRGISPPKTLQEDLRSISMQQTAAYLRGKLGVAESEADIIEEVNGMVEQGYRYEIPLKPHTAEFLQRLHSAGVKCCVATATDAYLAEAALERLGILHYFEFITTCTEVGQGKEVPVIFQYALEKLGTKKEETIIFEDALYAVKTAVNAGFRTIAMRDVSNETERDQLAALAERWAETFEELEVTAL